MTPATTSFRTAADGTRLFTRHWSTDGPRAAIVLVHGVGEHGGRYEHVGDQLASRGFDVRVSDLRGFGASEGSRAHIGSFDMYTADIAADIAEAKTLGVPVVLLGHSLGGLIAVRYAAGTRHLPDLLVLSAPAIDARLPRAKVLAARALVRIVPRLKMGNPVTAEQLSRDPSVGERYFADPLVVNKSTIGLGVAAINAMEEARNSLPQLGLPTLVIHGAEDTIVLPDFSEPFAELPNATRVVFEGFRHESFNEEGGRKAVATVVDWIEARLVD